MPALYAVKCMQWEKLWETPNSYPVFTIIFILLSRVTVTLDGAGFVIGYFSPLIHTTRDYSLQYTVSHRLVSLVYYILP
jgi:hypothetical protein